MPFGRVELIRGDIAILQRRLDKSDPSAVPVDLCAVFPTPGRCITGEVGGVRGQASSVVQVGAVAAHEVVVEPSGRSHLGKSLSAAVTIIACQC